MAETAANVLRTELREALLANTSRLCDALRAELARPISLDAGRRLQFEIDPFYFGIHSCATEEGLLPADWLDGALPNDWFERAEAAEGGWNEMISEELCPWFAQCWQDVAGPERFRPAYLFFHDYHHQQYDLEQGRWVSADVAFGGG